MSYYSSSDEVPEDLKDIYELKHEFKIFEEYDLFTSYCEKINSKNLEINDSTFDGFYSTVRKELQKNIKEIIAKKFDTDGNQYIYESFFTYLNEKSIERIYRFKTIRAPYYLDERESFEIYLQIFEKLSDEDILERKKIKENKSKRDEENAIKSEIKLLRKLLRKYKHVLKDEELRK